jgi:HK97 family phage major capsid protein
MKTKKTRPNWDNAYDLEVDRDNLKASLETILSTAKAAGTEPTADELATLTAGLEDVKEMTERIKELDSHPTTLTAAQATRELASLVTSTNDKPQPSLKAGDWINTGNNRRANLRLGEKLNDFPPLKAALAADKSADHSHSSIGRLVAAVTTSGASAVVPTTWSNQIIDLAIASSAIGQAGSTVIPMDRKTVEIGRITGDPTASFRTEGSSITESDPTFDNVTLTAHSLNALVVTSVEWLADAQDGSDLIEQTIAQAIARELDFVALYGGITTGHGVTTPRTSPPNPTGILAALQSQLSANAPAAATNGTTPTSGSFWAEMLKAAYLVRAGNHEPNAMIWNSSADLTYALATDTTGQPLNAPARLPRQVVSNTIPSYTQGTMTTATDAFVGDFSKLLIGVRGALTITTLKERYADNGQVGFLAWWRGDIQLADPKAFSVFSGIKGS